jgi:signal transduction histidine kinase
MVSSRKNSHPIDNHPDTLSFTNLLAELAQTPSTPLTMEWICDRIIERIVPLFACEGCWLLTPSRVDDKLELRAWRGLRPKSASDLLWVSKEGNTAPTVSDFGIDDAPAGLVWPDSAIGRIAISHIRSQDSHVGSIVLLFNDCRPLASRQQELLASLSSQISLIIRSVDLLLASQDLILQQERNRIAQEIHDGVSQNLALLMLKMEIISRLSQSDPSRMKTEIQKVMVILESSVFELRRSIATLRSPGVVGLGLLPAIKKLARDFTKETDIDVELSLPAALSLSPDVQSTLFSVIQERLSTIGKVGNSTRVSIEIESDEERVIASLSDSGALEATQPLTPDCPASVWLQRIGNRVKPLGGTVSMDTDQAHTTIQIALPLLPH